MQRIAADDIIGGADGVAAWWCTSDDEQRSTRAAAAGEAAQLHAPPPPPTTMEQNIRTLEEMQLANRTRALQVLEGCNNNLAVAIALLLAAANFD